MTSAQTSRPGRKPPALRHRNFRLFIAAQAISLVGTHVQNLAQVWLVLVLTGDALLVGLVTAVQALPIATVSLVGGVLADRISKRALLLGTQTAMLVLALVLAVLALTERVEVWHVIILAFALGCANAIDMPARQAFVVEMVGPGDVASAVGLNSAVYNAGRLVGPAFAGLVIAAITALAGSAVIATGAAFLINAATFAAVLIGLASIRERDLFAVERRAGPRRIGQIPREILDGLAYLASARPVLMTLLVPGAIAALAVNFNVLVPVYAHETGVGAGELGLLLSAVGLGALTSATWIGVGGAAGPRTLAGGALLLGVTTLFLGIIATPVVWPVLLFGAGLGASAMRTAANSQIQFATPGTFRGRVMSVYAIVFEGISPMGGLAVGALAAWAGARATFAITGVGALIVLALGAGFILGRIRAPSATTPG